MNGQEQSCLFPYVWKEGVGMPVTAQQVFDTALALMDEVTENGTITTETPEYYRTKAVSFINLLQVELLPPTAAITPITQLDQTLQLNDRIALLILPYGLAAHLLLNDDLSISSFFNDRYDELKRKIPTQAVPITDVYGALEVID